jgi:AAA ATPase domain
MDAVKIIGRSRELGELANRLDHACAGTGGLIVVTGPPGSGTTTLADAVAGLARRRGVAVLRASGEAGRAQLVVAELLRRAGAADTAASGPGPPVHTVLSAVPRLVIVDDADVAGAECIDFLAELAAGASGSGTLVVATSKRPLGIGHELRLGPLDEAAFGELAGPRPPEVRHALWVASRGRPGVARSLARELDEDLTGAGPLVALALRASSETAFLEVDVALVGLLERALASAGDEATRARLAARLASELLGDASAAVRRRELADQALAAARACGDRGVLAEVLDARLHALWDPAAAHDRLSAASEIADIARGCGDDALERRGMFWRFIALMELGRVGEAESALAAFRRVAELAGDEEALVMVTARDAMLAALRGRFDVALELAGVVEQEGRRLSVPDTQALVATLQGSVLTERGDPAAAEVAISTLLEAARRNPGHHFEATAARVMVIFGRDRDAETELARVLPRVLMASGPRWLGSMCDLALVAWRTGNASSAARLYERLQPYAGRLCVWGGANATTGPVSHFLGLLALTVGDAGAAVRYLDDAVAFAEQIGALPFLAHSLAARAEARSARSAAGDPAVAEADRSRARAIAERLGMPVLLARIEPPANEWSLARDGDDWLLQAGEERARLRNSRGMHYLTRLVATPGRDIAALDLAADGAGLAMTQEAPLLDDTARAAYRRRLAELDDELEAADAAGDETRARQAAGERDQLLAELRRATGLGGRDRGASAESERARVNVTRTLRATIDRIMLAAPRCGAHLAASIRTGRSCRYEPAPGGPVRWRLETVQIVRPRFTPPG